VSIMILIVGIIINEEYRNRGKYNTKVSIIPSRHRRDINK